MHVNHVDTDAVTIHLCGMREGCGEFNALYACDDFNAHGRQSESENIRFVCQEIFF